MILGVATRRRRELLWGGALGIYATALAMAPGLAFKALLAAPLLLVPAPMDTHSHAHSLAGVVLRMRAIDAAAAHRTR